MKFKYGSDKSVGYCPGCANRYWGTGNCEKYGSFQGRHFPRNVATHCHKVRLHITGRYRMRKFRCGLKLSVHWQADVNTVTKSQFP